MNWNQWLIVIPARLQSSRLPEKPLQDLCGKALIVRVYERLQSLKDLGAQIVVATDSHKILDVCKKENIEAMMTDEKHQSGTDRVHELSQSFDHSYILNVQGDEPFVNLEDLERLTQLMESQNHDGMGTLIYKNRDLEEFQNPNVVKAVIGEHNRALYFSRAPIPYHREQEFTSFWQHIGIYAYSKNALEAFCKLPPHRLEELEKLEQLRALGNGIEILAMEAKETSLGIDTPEDLEKARKLFSVS